MKAFKEFSLYFKITKNILLVVNFFSIMLIVHQLSKYERFYHCMYFQI